MTSRRFQRSMKIFGVLLLTLSSVTPASSVFVIIPGVIQQAGSGVIISLLAAGLVSLCMAFVYAELASAWPLSGGEYAMAGQALGPFAGYVLLGVNAAAYTLVPPVLSLGAATYVSVIWPHAPAMPIAIGIIVLSSLLGILNVRVNAWVTGIFLAVEVVALVVVAALGFAHPVRPLADVVLHPLRATAGAGLSATPAIAIAVSATVAIFAFNGYGAAVYFSEEMHEAPRKIARTILLALVITLALEFAPTLAIILAAPDLSGDRPLREPVRGFRPDRGRPAPGGGGQPRRGVRHHQCGDRLAADQRTHIVRQRPRRRLASPGERRLHPAASALRTRLGRRCWSPARPAPPVVSFPCTSCWSSTAWAWWSPMRRCAWR